MKLSEMKTADEVLVEDLETNPEFRAEWVRTAPARAVANYLVAYRAEHNLTQRELGDILGMAQSAVARLESGEHTPSFRILERLAGRLGVEFHIDITARDLTLATS